MLFVPQRHPTSNGTSLQTPFPPAYIPGPYDPPLPFIGRVPSLVNLCILSLAPFVDQVHQLPVQLRLRTRKALKDFGKPMDPRVWGVLVQVYDFEELPKGMRVSEAALSDIHVPLLQDVQPTERFTLLTVLELGKCKHLTDDTIRKLGVLSSLCAFDASENELSAYGVKCLAGTLNVETERGPWGLRILSLRGCTGVYDEVYEYLSAFPLLSVIDLRHTRCTYNKSFLSSSSFDPTSDQRLFHPTSLLDSVDLLQSIQSRLQSAPKEKSYVLHLNSLHYKPTQAQVTMLKKEKKYKPPPGIVQDSFVVLPKPGSTKGRVMTGHIDTLVKREKMKEAARVHEENKERWYEQNFGSGYGGPRVVETRKRDVKAVPLRKDFNTTTQSKPKPKLHPASSTTMNTDTVSSSSMPSSIYEQARSTLKSRQKCDDVLRVSTDPHSTHVARRTGSTAATSAHKPTLATPTPHTSTFTSSTAPKTDAKRRIQPQPQPTSTNTNLAKLKAILNSKAEARMHPTSDNRLHTDIPALQPSLDLHPSQARSRPKSRQKCDHASQVLADPHSTHPARCTGTTALTSSPSLASPSKAKDAYVSASAPRPTLATPMPTPTPHISTPTSSSAPTRKAKAKRPIHPLPDPHDRPTSTSTTAAANASISTVSAIVAATDVTRRGAATTPPAHWHQHPLSEELTALMASEMESQTTAQVRNKELNPQSRTNSALTSSSSLGAGMESASIGTSANANFTSRNQGRKRKRERGRGCEVSPGAASTSSLTSHGGDANVMTTKSLTVGDFGTLDVAISAGVASGSVNEPEEEGRRVDKTHWVGDSKRVSECEFSASVSAPTTDCNSSVYGDKQSPKRSMMATSASTAARTGTSSRLELADLDEVDGRVKEEQGVWDQYENAAEDASMADEDGGDDSEGEGDEDSAMYDSVSSTNLDSYDEYDYDSACGCASEYDCLCSYDGHWGDWGGCSPYDDYDDSDEYDSDGNRYKRKPPSYYDNIRQVRAMLRSEHYRNQPPSWHFGTGFRAHDPHAGGGGGGMNIKRRHVPEEMMLYRNPMPVEWLDEVREVMRRERGERGTIRGVGKEGGKGRETAKVDVVRLRMVGLAGRVRGVGLGLGVADRREGKRRKLTDSNGIGVDDNNGDVVMMITEDPKAVDGACEGGEVDTGSTPNLKPVSKPVISLEMLTGRLSQSAPVVSVAPVVESAPAPAVMKNSSVSAVQQLQSPKMKARNPIRRPMSGLGKVQGQGDLFSRFSLPASSVPTSAPVHVPRLLSTSSTPSMFSALTHSSKPTSTSSPAPASFRLPPATRMEIVSTSSDVLAARKPTASSKPSSRSFSINRQAQLPSFNVSSSKSCIGNSKADAKIRDDTAVKKTKKIIKSLSVPSFRCDERLVSGLDASGGGMTSKDASAGKGKAASNVRAKKPDMSAHSSSTVNHKAKGKEAIRTAPSWVETSATTTPTPIKCTSTQRPRPFTSDHDSNPDSPLSRTLSSHSPNTNAHTKLLPISSISVPILSDALRMEALAREQEDVGEVLSEGGAPSSRGEVARKKVKLQHNSHNSSTYKKPRKSGSTASTSVSKNKSTFDWKAWSKEGRT